MPRLHGSLEAIDFFEKLFNLLLNGHGIGSTQQWDGGKPSPTGRQGGQNLLETSSPVFTRRFKVGRFVVNYYFDKRTGQDRQWGGGHIDVPVGLLEELEARQNIQNDIKVGGEHGTDKEVQQ